MTVNGDKVTFPGGKRYQFPLVQARGAAAVLANWLEERTGEKSWVNAQVVTPGWVVAYLGKQNLAICETACLASFLMKPEPTLSKERREALALAMDSKCRTLRFEIPDNPLSLYSHHAPPNDRSIGAGDAGLPSDSGSSQAAEPAQSES